MKNENINFDSKETVLNGHHKKCFLNGNDIGVSTDVLPEILFITSYPPRECGIATYSQDLIKALNNKFGHSFLISVCPLESDNEKHYYTDEIKYTLNTDVPDAFSILAKSINEDKAIQIVMIQHEFGFFEKKESHFNEFLSAVTKPIVIVFHTVLPHPNEVLKAQVKQIASVAESIIVMTNTSANILVNDYISKSPLEEFFIHRPKFYRD